ncbi:MAG: MucR family transcriptional regulator [Pseudomonadota bacterium]
MAETAQPALDETLHLTTDIVVSYLEKNALSAEKIPSLLQEVHNTVTALARGATANAGAQQPAVPVAKSITPDYIICLEDGAKMKMLKRYLRTQYDMSPEDYRRKWGLPADYPMVSPNYSKKRSKYAKDLGLGKGPTATKKRKAKAPAKKRTGAKRGPGRPRKAT